MSGHGILPKMGTFVQIPFYTLNLAILFSRTCPTNKLAKGSDQPSQLFDSYFALETFCQVLILSFQKKFNIILRRGRWSGHINNFFFVHKISKNNSFDVYVERLYLTKKWRVEDENLFFGYRHVLGPTSSKSNLQTRIFHSIFVFEKLGKKS